MKESGAVELLGILRRPFGSLKPGVLVQVRPLSRRRAASLAPEGRRLSLEESTTCSYHMKAMSSHRLCRNQIKNSSRGQDNKVSEIFFHKTKMCKFFPQGACIKGESCSFAHVQSELACPPDLYRTRMCMAYIKIGRCKDGDHCKYAHQRAELRDGTSAIRAETDFQSDSIERGQVCSKFPTSYEPESELSPNRSCAASMAGSDSMQDQLWAAHVGSMLTAPSHYLCMPIDGGYMTSNAGTYSSMFHSNGATLSSHSQHSSMSGCTTTADDVWLSAEESRSSTPTSDEQALAIASQNAAITASKFDYYLHERRKREEQMAEKRPGNEKRLEDHFEEELNSAFSNIAGFKRQYSAPARLDLEESFLRCKDIFEPQLHESTGIQFRVKNTFLDFGTEDKGFGSKTRSPSA